MTGQPWPFPWPPEEHCYAHGAHEPVPRSGAYQVCGECGHVYVSAQDLLNAYVQNAPDPEINIPAPESVVFCPVCMHDF